MHCKLLDVCYAYKEVITVQSTPAHIRNDIGSHHKRWFKQPVAMAEEFGVQQSVPISCKGQT